MSGVEYALPCKVAWVHAGAPYTVALVVDGIRSRSTFYGAPLMPARLAKGDAAHTVLLDEDGQVERFILQTMDGTAPNQEIAQRLMDRFPRRFRQFNEALGRVGSVARRFGRD